MLKCNVAVNSNVAFNDLISAYHTKCESTFDVPKVHLQHLINCHGIINVLWHVTMWCDNLFIWQCDTDDGISSDSESPTSVHSLMRQMQEKEKCILLLEAQVAKVIRVIRFLLIAYI